MPAKDLGKAVGRGSAFMLSEQSREALVTNNPFVTADSPAAGLRFAMMRASKTIRLTGLKRWVKVFTQSDQGTAARMSKTALSELRFLALCPFATLASSREDLRKYWPLRRVQAVAGI